MSNNPFDDFVLFDDTVFCTLFATVRQPALASCRAAALGELAGSDNTIFCTLRRSIFHCSSWGQVEELNVLMQLSIIL
jgi:hypothetical protein